MDQIGSVIRSLRKERGLTQSQVCGDRMTRNLLSQIENGAVNPSLQTLQYLAERLEIPMSALFMNERDRFLLRKEEQIEKIRALYEDGKDEECVSLVSSSAFSDVEANRYQILCSNRLADRSFESGNWEEAGKRYRETENVNPNDPFSVEERMHARARLQMIGDALNGEITDPFPDGLNRNPDRRLLRLIREQIGNGYSKSLSGLIDGLRFENEDLRILAKAMICEALGNDIEGRSFQMRVNEDTLDPFLRLFLYTMSEKCCVRMNDFESAYRYAKKRQQLLDGLKSKYSAENPIR